MLILLLLVVLRDHKISLHVRAAIALVIEHVDAIYGCIVLSLLLLLL